MNNISHSVLQTEQVLQNNDYCAPEIEDKNRLAESTSAEEVNAAAAVAGKTCPQAAIPCNDSYTIVKFSGKSSKKCQLPPPAGCKNCLRPESKCQEKTHTHDTQLKKFENILHNNLVNNQAEKRALQLLLSPKSGMIDEKQLAVHARSLLEKFSGEHNYSSLSKNDIKIAFDKQLNEIGVSGELREQAIAVLSQPIVDMMHTQQLLHSKEARFIDSLFITQTDMAERIVSPDFKHSINKKSLIGAIKGNFENSVINLYKPLIKLSQDDLSFLLKNSLRKYEPAHHLPVGDLGKINANIDELAAEMVIDAGRALCQDISEQALKAAQSKIDSLKNEIGACNDQKTKDQLTKKLDHQQRIANNLASGVGGQHVNPLKALDTEALKNYPLALKTILDQYGLDSISASPLFSAGLEQYGADKKALDGIYFGLSDMIISLSGAGLAVNLTKSGIDLTDAVYKQLSGELENDNPDSDELKIKVAAAVMENLASQGLQLGISKASGLLAQEALGKFFQKQHLEIIETIDGFTPDEGALILKYRVADLLSSADPTTGDDWIQKNIDKMDLFENIISTALGTTVSIITGD